jgi:antirestriction protein ArdC
VLILALAGYRSRWWGSYRQIQQLNGQVRRGEKATHIILFKPIIKTRTNGKGDEVEERIPVVRTFCVFNAEQTEGLDYLLPGRTELALAAVEERYQHADEVVAATGADIRHGGNDAFFSLTDDYIQMPFRHQFPSLPHYYECLCHELIHWSESRLNWDRPLEGYAAGELVAEIGGCFMTSELGLPPGESLTSHAAYLQSWLQAMQNDPKYIFRASAQASKAVDYLLSFSRKPEAEEVAA